MKPAEWKPDFATAATYLLIATGFFVVDLFVWEFWLLPLAGMFCVFMGGYVFGRAHADELDRQAFKNVEVLERSKLDNGAEVLTAGFYHPDGSGITFRTQAWDEAGDLVETEYAYNDVQEARRNHRGLGAKVG